MKVDDKPKADLEEIYLLQNGDTFRYDGHVYIAVNPTTHLRHSSCYGVRLSDGVLTVFGVDTQVEEVEAVVEVL